MTRLRMIVLLLFVVAFGAGLTAGRLWSKQHAPPPHSRGPSGLAAELGLSDEQREKMIAIWDQVNHSGFDEWRQRRELQRQRNDAIAALVPAEQHAQLETINENYSQQVSDLFARRRERFAQAVEETKAILNDQQRVKYEAILARREQERRDRGRPDRGDRPERSERSDRPDRAQRDGQPSQDTSPAETVQTQSEVESE